MKPILSLMQWETRVADMYGMAQSCRMSHDALLTMRADRIHAELNRCHGKTRRVYSAYVAGYVAGLDAVHRAALYRYHLEFCYQDADGTLYSTHKDSVHRKTDEWYARGAGADLGKLPSGHYWRGTDRLFYGSGFLARLAPA